MKELFSNSPTLEIEKWEKVGEETKLAGKFGLSLMSQWFVDPRTQVADEYAFFRKSLGFTAVPVLPNGNLVITRTFKHGSNKIVWEFPAGMNMDEEEKGKPIHLARAELKEESGLRSRTIVFLGIACAPGPRKYDTVEYLYAALDCEVLPSGPKPGKDEILEVYELTPEELWELIRQGDGSFSGFSEMAAQRAADKGLIRRP